METLELFKKAIEFDPQFARAYTRLAVAYDQQANFAMMQGPANGLLETARVALLKSIALDPTDGTAHAILGEIYFSLGDLAHLIRGAHAVDAV